MKSFQRGRAGQRSADFRPFWRGTEGREAEDMSAATTTLTQEAMLDEERNG